MNNGKMAIVKKDGDQWMITSIMLSDEEVNDLRKQLDEKSLDPNKTVSVDFRVVFQVDGEQK